MLKRDHKVNVLQPEDFPVLENSDTGDSFQKCYINIFLQKPSPYQQLHTTIIHFLYVYVKCPP